MERSAGEAQLATETNAASGVLQLPEQKVVRRRLVQSTLFPHNSPVKKTRGNCREKKGKEVVADEGDDEGYSGCQGRKQRQPKRKTASTPRKSPIRKKQENCGKRGKEVVGDGGDDDEEYTGSQGRRKRKSTSKTASIPRKKAACCRKVAFTGGMDGGDSPDDGSPQKVKETKRVLVRNGRINGTTETFREEMSNQHIVISSPPDLRLEAKMRAEENSRLFAGKQPHPFFSRRMGKKNLETTCVGNKIKDEDSNFAPIHVFESDKDDFGPTDWSKWTFHEDIFSNANLDLKLESMTSACNFSAGSLHLDDILDVSNPPEVSAVLKDATLLQYPGNEELCRKAGVSDETGLSLEGSGVGKLSLSTTVIDCLSSDIKQQNIVLQERSQCSLMSRLSYHFSCNNQPEKSLWTNKYQPDKASEVCGNADSVKFINDWLQLWRDQDLGNSSTLYADKCFIQGNCHRDSDVEDIDEEAGLKNVLLVTGPVGCGKSAAVYACAKEQGFNIIEVNSSDWRNGALLKQKFEEAAGSHCIKQRFEEAVGPHFIKRTQESPLGSQGKLDMNSCPAVPGSGMEAQDCKNVATELISVSDDEHSNNNIGASRSSICTEAKIDRDQGEVGTLIFFEDIEATLSEDPGFITAIQYLAGTGRRPMILTSNSNYSVLPDSLRRDEVWFTMPSPMELLCHLNKVCFAEMVNIQSCIIEKFIQYCKGDIRKILLHLQFWSQGSGYEIDQRACSIYGPLLFDLEAGHGLLPTLLPLGHSSQLSEHIEREITRSLSGLEDIHDLFEIFEEEMANFSLQNDLDVHNDGRNTIEARKEAILSQNVLANDDNNLKALVRDACDSPNSSGSPVVFTRRRMRGLFDSVVSSESEEDIVDDQHPAVSDKIGQVGISNVSENADVDSEVPFEGTTLDGSLKALNNHLIHLPEVQALEASHPCSVTPNVSLVSDKCQSIDVSCVPESTFVPDTIDNGIELPSRADRTEVISPLTVGNVDEATFGPHEATEPTQFAGDASVNMMNCQMADFQSEHEYNEIGASEYQVMDECSRVDFFKVSKPLRKCSSRPARKSVQETWNELRQTHPREHFDLDHEDDSQSMELAYSMSNLISETDLLLHDCQMLLDDSPNQNIGPNEDNDYFTGLDRQVRMASTAAEHGYCFYGKAAAAISSKMGLDDRLDVVKEILDRKNGLHAIGKLLRQNRGSHQTAFVERSVKAELSTKDMFPEREGEKCLDIVQSLVPSRSYLAVRGSAFHEYLSSLAQISRSEAFRLSLSPDTTKRWRRARVAKNYLSSGALDLSQEEVSFLTKFSCYGNSAPKVENTVLKKVETR